MVFNLTNNTILIKNDGSEIPIDGSGSPIKDEDGNILGIVLTFRDISKIAIEKLQTKSYDIILMDLLMPEMNGFEATEYIRNKMNSKIPILALTADVTTVDVEKCKAVGMNDYIFRLFVKK